MSLTWRELYARLYAEEEIAEFKATATKACGSLPSLKDQYGGKLAEAEKLRAAVEGMYSELLGEEAKVRPDSHTLPMLSASSTA